MYNVTTIDDYRFYLQEVNKHPLLTSDEERETALEYFYTKNIEAAHKLIVSSLRFVVKIANEYRKYEFPIMDLIQEGNIGLMNAVKKFDPYKGFRLLSYAVFWIRERIESYIRRCWNMVKIDTTDANRHMFNDPEDDKHIAKYSSLQIEDAKLRKQRDVYLHDNISEDGSYLIDCLSADIEPVDKQIEYKQEELNLKTKVNSVLDTLTEREQYIVKHRLMDDKQTHKEIGEKFGVTKEAIRQAEEKLIHKLKTLLA